MNDSNAFVHSAETLVVPIRMGEGLNPVAVEDFYETLSARAREWQRQGSVPLADAAVLAAIYADIEAASYSYPPSTAESIREQARQLSERLLEHLHPLR
jgi:hypothetical protein